MLVGMGPIGKNWWWRREQGNCWSDILKEGEEDGIHCIGRKAGQLPEKGSMEAGTGGLTGEGSEGTPLKGHWKESATIPFPFSSLEEPVGEVC